VAAVLKTGDLDFAVVGRARTCSFRAGRICRSTCGAIAVGPKGANASAYSPTSICGTIVRLGIF
jgi:hypothetical protein